MFLAFFYVKNLFFKQYTYYLLPQYQIQYAMSYLTVTLGISLHFVV